MKSEDLYVGATLRSKYGKSPSIKCIGIEEITATFEWVDDLSEDLPGEITVSMAALNESAWEVV